MNKNKSIDGGVCLLLFACAAAVFAQGTETYKDKEVSAGGATTTRFALYSNCRTKAGGDVLDVGEREQCQRVLDARAREVVSAGGLTALKADLDDNCLRMNQTSAERTACMSVQAALLPPLDPTRREEFGESYDPRKYLECRIKHGPAVADCDLYRLRRKPHPEYWPNPNLPRPVISDGDKKVYRPGMSSEEYFKALCEAEAGEFIYKTVEDVEAVYQIRPREDPTLNLRIGQDRYVLEAPMFIGAQVRQAQRSLHGAPPFRYPVFEKPNLSEDGKLLSPPYFRYEGYESKRTYDGRESSSSLAPIPVSELRSRYGYYWYGIKRPMDRELAVSGGEMVVVDLRTNEVLALKRSFSLGVSDRWGKGYSPTGIAWNIGGVCPASSDPPYALMLSPSADKKFLNKVLKPRKANVEGEKK